MIRIEIDVSVPSVPGQPTSLLDVTTLVSESVNAGFGDAGAVVHRMSVEEVDA